MNMHGYSIIVCTYNPDPELFSAVRGSLLNMAKKTSAPLEVLIIDNNSLIPLSKDDALNAQFKDVVDYKVIREERSGLTHARIAGYLNARYDWLIFVDDDNLPCDNYINELQSLVESTPEVKCWGAGKIDVEYIGRKETPFLDSVKALFQERNLKGVHFSCNRKGEDYYPPGSCICINSIVFEKYYELFRKGLITSGDRAGNSLNSAGDAQIIYCSIRNNFCVGSSGGLQLKHLISKTKTKFSYLIRLVYALNSCHIKAYNEVFSDDPVRVTPGSDKEICRAIYSHFRIEGFSPVRKTLLDISRLMGIWNARHIAGNFRKPLVLSTFEKIIGHQ